MFIHGVETFVVVVFALGDWNEDVNIGHGTHVVPGKRCGSVTIAMKISVVMAGLQVVIRDVIKQYVDQIVGMEDNVLSQMSAHVLMVLQGTVAMELLHARILPPATQETARDQVALDHVSVLLNFLETHV